VIRTLKINTGVWTLKAKMIANAWASGNVAADGANAKLILLIAKNHPT